MTIGDLIKEYRIKLDLTQKELADRSGLAVGTIQQYESGKRVPIIKNLKRISDILNIDLEYMLNIISGKKDPSLERRNLYRDEVLNIFKTVHKEWYDDPDLRDDKSVPRLLNAYASLNKHGKKQLILRAEELTEIKKYTEPDDK